MTSSNCDEAKTGLHMPTGVVFQHHLQQGTSGTSERPSEGRGWLHDTARFALAGSDLPGRGTVVAAACEAVRGAAPRPPQRRGGERAHAGSASGRHRSPGEASSQASACTALSQIPAPFSRHVLDAKTREPWTALPSTPATLREPAMAITHRRFTCKKHLALPQSGHSWLLPMYRVLRTILFPKPNLGYCCDFSSAY